jgi:hypothetical protein
MTYDFLLLSLLFMLPGALVFFWRPDLRRGMGMCAIASLPFAATERFFYPDYWSPRFLFNLIEHIGFGIEDIMFVVALAAYMTTAYPFVFRKALHPVAPGPLGPMVRRAGLFVLALLVLALGLLLLRVPILYGSFAAMLAGAVVMLARRRDLVVPALLGAALSTLTYAVVCLVYAWLMPGVFGRVWHTERFLHRYVLGVPVEELAYGFCAGVAAAAFLPFVTGQVFAPQRTDSTS